jgi:hypothetical protein
VIRTSFNGEPVVEMKTIGHEYRSIQIAVRDGALYIDCENLDWNEKESFIFNIGFETNPQVLWIDFSPARDLCLSDSIR